MQLNDSTGARFASAVKSLQNNLSTNGKARAVVAYRQSRPWHVLSYWLRSSSRGTGGWFKKMIADQREWLRQPVHLPTLRRRTEISARTCPTIIIGSDLSRERPFEMIRKPGHHDALLAENRRLREVIDLLLRFGPEQLWRVRSTRADKQAPNLPLVGSLGEIF